MALYEKYVWNSSTNEWDLVVNPDSLFYVAGTGSTAGTWLGSHSRISEYYDGLTIAYKIPVAGASTTTLNINGLGARTVRRNTGNLTTHLPVNTVVLLTYTTISSTGYWVWADYNSSYSLITQEAINAGTETTSRTINASLLRNNFYLKSETDTLLAGKAASDHAHTWGQITGKPSWIGSSKPSYNLGEIADTSAYIKVTPSNKDYWNSKANSTHVHAAGDINSGTFSVARGGTGRASLTSNSVLVGNGTNAVSLVSRSGIDTRSSFPPSVHSHSMGDVTGLNTALITAGRVQLLRSRSGTTALTVHSDPSVSNIGSQLTRGDTIMVEVYPSSSITSATPKVLTFTVASNVNSASLARSVTYSTWTGDEFRVYSLSCALISNGLTFGNANYMRMYKSGTNMIITNATWTPYIGRIWKVVGN